MRIRAVLFGGHSTGGAVGVAVQAKCKQTGVTMAELLGKYENWTLQQLKDALRSRQAKVSGRKAELVGRYITRNNF